jgi:hypothetical protein
MSEDIDYNDLPKPVQLISGHKIYVKEELIDLIENIALKLNLDIVKHSIFEGHINKFLEDLNV